VTTIEVFFIYRTLAGECCNDVHLCPNNLVKLWICACDTSRHKRQFKYPVLESIHFSFHVNQEKSWFPMPALLNLADTIMKAKQSYQQEYNYRQYILSSHLNVSHLPHYE
jgi:hypothetical protein